ncbi:hypothetical protein D3C81_1595030 [compost metagenome]
MAQTPEGKVKDRAKELYKKYGAKYDRAAMTGMGQNGRSDDIVLRSPDGHFGGVEFKRDDVWRVSDLQRLWLLDAAAKGGSAMVVNLTNLGMLERWLQRPGTRIVPEFEGNKCVRHWAYVPGHPPFEVKNPTP